MIAIDVQMSILATKPQIVYATGGELHTQGVGVWVWGGGGCETMETQKGMSN